MPEVESHPKLMGEFNSLKRSNDLTEAKQLRCKGVKESLLAFSKVLLHKGIPHRGGNSFKHQVAPRGDGFSRLVRARSLKIFKAGGKYDGMSFDAEIGLRLERLAREAVRNGRCATGDLAERRPAACHIDGFDS